MSSTLNSVEAADVDDDRLDHIFHALADRTRRSLLARLAQGPARVSVLAEPFAMTLPAVSKHLRVLERAGLVQRTINGRVHRCALNPQPLQELEAWVTHYRAFWDSALDALAMHLESEEE